MGIEPVRQKQHDQYLSPLVAKTVISLTSIIPHTARSAHIQ